MAILRSSCKRAAAYCAKRVSHAAACQRPFCNGHLAAFCCRQSSEGSASTSTLNGLGQAAMIGKNRIMIYGPKDDGTYVIEFRTLIATSTSAPAAAPQMVVTSNNCESGRDSNQSSKIMGSSHRMGWGLRGSGPGTSSYRRVTLRSEIQSLGVSPAAPSQRAATRLPRSQVA
jgi:hypothetical protein